MFFVDAAESVAQISLAVEAIKEETNMSRHVGDRYSCESCGAQLVYEKSCPCPEGKPHSEICCGKQMTAVKSEGSAAQASADKSKDKA